MLKYIVLKFPDGKTRKFFIHKEGGAYPKLIVYEKKFFRNKRVGQCKDKKNIPKLIAMKYATQ
ncbi:hypothetical protein VAMP_237n65 [Candidatus Vampirococcus lugosii]|uniref:Uncharacterized protein n=1 Tax=Candidatus Vampirococcus lugosii TaxID=2789015 RepID=A0ABS5QM39_9BACT|nr:hypothetical protein [Candidatus Vampirococcus lugosii]